MPKAGAESLETTAEPAGLDLTATPASATAAVVLYNVQECLVKVNGHDEVRALPVRTSGPGTPTTLSLVDIGQAPEQLKANPAFFDASNDTIEQHFATGGDESILRVRMV